MRWPAGPVFAVVPAVLAAWVGGSVAAGAVLLGSHREEAGGLAAVTWAGWVFGLAFWPATRRWCGLLPPLPTDADV